LLKGYQSLSKAIKAIKSAVHRSAAADSVAVRPVVDSAVD
jgi:ribosomal protein L31E